MQVVRAVGDEQEQARRRQALNETIEQRLRLGIQPVQIFTDQQQRLPLTLTQQHPLGRAEGVLAALRGLELPEGALRGQGVEQRQERRHRVLEGRVERQHLLRHLDLYGAGVVPLLQAARAPQQVEDGEVGRGLAVGQRGAVEHPPAWVWAAWTHSARRRDFPTPASPTTATTWPCPAAAWASAAARTASSVCRPTKG